MPISSHCFWPCDSSPAGRSSASSSPIWAAASSMRSRSAPLRRARNMAHTRRSCFRASVRLSRTLRRSNTVGFWNLRPMPTSAICASVRCSRSMRSPKNTCPSSGRVLPVMTSISVVLPAPLGPIRQRSSPWSTYSVRSLSALKPSKETLTPSTNSAPSCGSCTPPGALLSADVATFMPPSAAAPATRPVPAAGPPSPA